MNILFKKKEKKKSAVLTTAMEDDTVSEGAMNRVVVSEALTFPADEEMDATVETEFVTRQLLLPVI